MPTFKVVLRNQKRDGTFPVFIRIYHHGKSNDIGTGYVVEGKFVTAKKKIKDQRIADMAEQTMRELRNRCIDMGSRIDELTATQLAEILRKPKEQKKDRIEFFGFAEQLIAEMRRNGHKGNAQTYGNAVNALKKFAGAPLYTDEVTVDLLNRWMAKLAETTKGRAPSLYFAQIRAVWNKLRNKYNDEDTGNIPIPNNPFPRVNVPKAPAPRKRAVTVEQIRQIVRLPKHENPMLGKDHFDIFNLARDMFVLSFLLIGINEADLFEAGPLVDGRLVYERKKTRNRRDDRAEISIKIEPEAMMYIEHYKDPDGKRLLKFYHTYSSVNAFSMAINKGLKQIGEIVGAEGLTYYAARHSWATIAVNDCEVDKYVVHQALNHVDAATAITDIYIKKDWGNVDKANRKVIDYLEDE